MESVRKTGETRIAFPKQGSIVWLFLLDMAYKVLTRSIRISFINRLFFQSLLVAQLCLVEDSRWRSNLSRLVYIDARFAPFADTNVQGEAMIDSDANVLYLLLKRCQPWGFIKYLSLDNNMLLTLFSILAFRMHLKSLSYLSLLHIEFRNLFNRQSDSMPLATTITCHGYVCGNGERAACAYALKHQSCELSDEKLCLCVLKL